MPAVTSTWHCPKMYKPTPSISCSSCWPLHCCGLDQSQVMSACQLDLSHLQCHSRVSTDKVDPPMAASRQQHVSQTRMAVHQAVYALHASHKSPAYDVSTYSWWFQWQTLESRPSETKWNKHTQHACFSICAEDLTVPKQSQHHCHCSWLRRF